MCPALLFIDLDGFKTVNDTLGHEAGDELLVDVAQRLKLCVREGDTVARLGGDEFVILVENLEPPRNVLQFAERVLSELELPVAGTSIVVTASIGVVLPKAGMSARALLTQADKAMYRAKQAGRARYALAGD